MDNQEQLDMAYAAGALDGDGSFSVAKLANGRASPLYFPLVQLGSGRDVVPRFLHGLFGGHMVVTAPRKTKDGTLGQPYHQWKLRSAEPVSKFLARVSSCLIQKKGQAQLIGEFIEENPFIRGQRLDGDTLLRRERAYLGCLSMNDAREDVGHMPHRPPTTTKDKSFWSYMGGMMDTDGSFSVKKQRAIDKSARYSPVILLSSVLSPVMHHVCRNCSIGKVYAAKNVQTRKGFHYQYGIYGKSECIEFIENILPYLKVKREQASILLDFCKRYSQTGYCKLGVPKEEIEFREDCYAKVIELNKYGVLKPSLIDLEAQKQGDRAEGESHRDRLSEKASQEDAIVSTPV